MISANTATKATLHKPFCPFLTGILLFFVLLFSESALAQTVGTSKLTCNSPDRCTSNDLQVVSVQIDAPKCASCSVGDQVEYPLKMTIHNGTKSVRTSFALYGSLSSGATINGISGNVFICVGEVTVKSDQLLPGETAPGNQTFAVGTIKFTCGQDLTLSNNYLAWTDASGTTAERCTTFSNATVCADIAPKCGTASSIKIVGPVTPPTLTKVDPTCTTSTGCVKVTSSTTGLTFSIDNGSFTAYPTGGWCNLAPGEHCVKSKRTSDGCISPAACITIAGAPANPDRPVVTLQEATICGTVTTPSITVSCPIVGTYKLTQPGQTDKTFNYTGSNGPVKFNVLPGIGFSVTVTTAAGCTSAATNCDNYKDNACPTAKIAQTTAVTRDVIEQASIVTAAPNPFNDQIRFSITPSVSGRGSLDLYNMLGQKVKTVFQGQVQKGQTQVIEYSVPYSQRSTLIYQFNVGRERLSGKLVGLK